MTDENFFEFLTAAAEAAGDKQRGSWGTLHKFKCPLCGNSEAVAQRSAYNGHLYAECDNCGTKIIE